MRGHIGSRKLGLTGPTLRCAANDTYGFVLAAHPGKPQGRPGTPPVKRSHKNRRPAVGLQRAKSRFVMAALSGCRS